MGRAADVEKTTQVSSNARRFRSDIGFVHQIHSDVVRSVDSVPAQQL